MPLTHLHAVVRLKADVPKLRLRCGREGVVVSVWLLPGDLYFEVEFHRSNGSPAVRALLCSEQLEAVGPQTPKLAME
jgi:hypothetical protein